MHQNREIIRHFREDFHKSSPGMDTVDGNRHLILLGQPEMEGEKAFLVFKIGISVCFIKTGLPYSEPDIGCFFLLDELPQGNKFNF